MFASAKEALQFIAEQDIAMVDLKITGLSGQWLHVTIPAANFGQKHFEEGVGYDGSSGSGFGRVEDGDVAALPEPSTGFVDPFCDLPTLSFLCDTVRADTKAPLPSDPRSIAKRAVAYMKSSGIADQVLMGPEFEFHVFNSVDFVTDPYESGFSIKSGEVHSDGTTAPIPLKRGYMRTPPADQLHNLRSEIALTMQNLGIAVRYHHHEVGAPGQCEVEVDLDDMIRVADRTLLIKYVVKNVAHRHGKIATFMPKPVFGEAGNGMHVHQRLRKGNKPLFYDETGRNYAHLSDAALHYVCGILAHGRALTGLTNPSTNSFKRLVEGYEAPVNLFFSLANRSAAIRIPRYAVSPEDKRIEYRPPDFTGNIYLTLAGMLMAGLDGIQSKLNPAGRNFGPFDVDIARQDEAFRQKIAPLPRSLHDALTALEEDQQFLLAGEVFNKALLDTWIAGKRAGEAAAVASRPHPYEFYLYLDA